MKIFSIAAVATGVTAKGFNNIAIGGAQAWGHLTWQSESGVLLVTVDNSNGNDCSAIDTGFSVNPSPYAVNDWETAVGIPLETGATGNTKEICANIWDRDWSESGNLSPFVATANSCVSTTEVSARAAALLDEEFNSVSFRNSGDKVCATLTKNRLAYAETKDATFFRSWDRQYYAWHQSDIGFVSFAAYSAAHCRKGLLEQWTSEQYSAEKWWSFGPQLKTVRSVEINGHCITLKYLTWKKAAKKVVMDTNYKSLSLELSQDNPFVPTHYYFEYDRVESEFNDGFGFPGKYHIHVGQVDSSASDLPTRCGPAATEGHFNPYGLVGPFAENSQTNYDYESGDLSLRFGSLAGADEVFVDVMDWNIPLHGNNAVNEMSIVFHNAADNSRLICWDLTEKNVGQNGHRGH